MLWESSRARGMVSKEDARDLLVAGNLCDEAGLGALGPAQLSVLAAVWSYDTPLTAGQLAGLTGMSRAAVREVLQGLQAQKLLVALNTLVQSYRPCWAPEARP